LSVALMSDPKGADLRPYLSEVAKTIRKKWVQTSRLSFSAQREVNLQFSIDRSGRVRNVIICCISGFADIDQSVAHVVRASSPFPLVPDSFQVDAMALRLKFSVR
jgi:TonB family protein